MLLEDKFNPALFFNYNEDGYEIKTKSYFYNYCLVTIDNNKSHHVSVWDVNDDNMDAYKTFQFIELDTNQDFLNFLNGSNSYLAELREYMVSVSRKLFITEFLENTDELAK